MPTRYPAEIKDGRLVSKRGDTYIPILFFTFPSARYLMIFFHSNAEDIGRSYLFCTQLVEQFHVHVMAVEYPGYGIAGGSVSAERVLEAADAAINFVREVLKWDDDSILIMGRSIGTAPALHLAAKYPKLGGLILISPFLSITSVLEDKLGSLARMFTIKERFDNAALTPHVFCQTIVIHGQKDSVVPCAHGREIFESLTCRKLFVAPVQMTHNTYLFHDPRLMAVPMLHFLSLPDYSIRDDFKLPSWMSKLRRLGHDGNMNVEVSWDATSIPVDGKQVEPPMGDVCGTPPLLCDHSYKGRPPKSMGDGVIEDGEKSVSLIGLNSTSREGLDSIRVRLPNS